MSREPLFDSVAADLPSDGFDFHKAITKKERSSRYLRTGIDYITQVQGREACDAFLAEIGVTRDSSIFKHIYDDENWNSYALEVYFYNALMKKFPDPFEAIWEFGVASGSGRLDQKDTLFAFKIKVAPVMTILRKAAETAHQVSLISNIFAELQDPPRSGERGWKGVKIHFNYDMLPEGFKYPHWTSVVAGYGLIHGLFRFRKGLEIRQEITHWPNLPSDLPSFKGKHYDFDSATKNVVERESGQVVANAKDGPFQIDGVTFNHGVESICYAEWKPESIWTHVARNTYQRRRLKKEEAEKEIRDDIVRDLTVEHQAQLARYEKELSEKITEIQMLKIQQDGDYFLTSLLTKPLISNRNKSETVTTEFHIEQKKRFEFRNRKSELGGDICSTDSVELQGRRYMVFVNGDAMGKSMQGAGGALVLGVVWNAYLTRSRFSRHQMRKSPELWLRDGYYELQNVFIAFDGSMFISVVMGLVDEENGMMYFINAEHPNTVLYRKGRASFIEDELLLRKIGTPGEQDKIQIRTFQLEPGDIVIAGSDGRDDLEVGRNKDDIRIINEDETEFLRRTEEGRGELALIMERIHEHGELTDDLSLLRIAYRHNEARVLNDDSNEYSDRFREATRILREGNSEDGLAALEQLSRDFPDECLTHRYMGRVQYKLKLYEQAVENMEKYFHRFPADNELGHLLSMAYKRLGNYAQAIDYGEKLVLRDPGVINYLINLTDCYRLGGRFDQAFEILNRARELEPTNSRVEKLERLLKSANVSAG